MLSRLINVYAILLALFAKWVRELYLLQLEKNQNNERMAMTHEANSFING